MRSSMLAAIERGRTPAVDYLNGEVCTRGRELGVATPTNDAARDMVWAIARGEQRCGIDALQALRTIATAKDTACGAKLASPEA
jgi:2-dehydropantoate 2-reductase